MLFRSVLGYDGTVSQPADSLQPPQPAVALTEPRAGSPPSTNQAVEPRPYDLPKFPDEYDIEGGRFFLRTGDTNGTGYAVTDAGDIPFWTFFNGFGGADRFGYPVSQRYVFGGLVMQAFQESIFQWDVANARVNFFQYARRTGRKRIRRIPVGAPAGPFSPRFSG